ncbi:MAG: hypothetical protein DI549_14890 [Ancylobacter novellus]|uniref:Polyvalent protein metallopeptidase domain-containing protein n=1 Tax=Ancylobacter novellus TaxID=921 RepID=A0A2W5QWV5_ANCNO|nr:MAG: hypothetical protein DI549_14890 [Ancylobacter novellus]
MKRNESGPRTDIYARITEKLVAALEKGVRPWVQPWSAGNVKGRVTRPLRHNGEPYTGMNVLLLWSESMARGLASAAYAAEECCVEILSGLVLADLGVAHHPRPDHAAYVASWLKVLKDDPKAIFTAASKAQQAADWMHAQQPQAEEMAA